MSSTHEPTTPGALPIPGTITVQIPDIARLKRLRELTAARDYAQVFAFALAVYEKLLVSAEAGEIPGIITEARTASGDVNGMIEYAPIRLYPTHEPNKIPKSKG